MTRALRRLRIDDPAWLRFGPWGSALFVAAGCALIFCWHVQFLEHSHELDETYASPPGVKGIFPDQIPVFFYFFYYTGKYPIYYTGKRQFLTEDAETAHRHLAPRRPNVRSKLTNEVQVVIRKGDRGQILLLYPDAWKTGRTLSATARTANRALALASMLALFVSFSLLQHRLLGSLLVMLVGSHPFAVYHLYEQINIWGYSIAAGSLSLALAAPLIFSRRPRRFHWAVPVAAGILLACFREVRTEPAALGASVAIACAFAPGDWRRKTALVALLAGSFLATSGAWSRFWDAKMDEAREIVRAARGRPLESSANAYHTLWHPIWCGLGDFGREYGYHWYDLAAYSYALPLMNERYGLDLKRKPGAFLLASRDEGGNQLTLSTMPEYSAVLREKVIGDITNDPIWYLDVLRQRFGRIMNGTTPVRIAWGAEYVDVPFTAWLVLPMLAMSLYGRRWDQAQVLLFYGPTSVPAFLIYSGDGFTNPTVLHLAAFAVLVCWVVHIVTDLAGERAARSRESRARG